MEREVFEELFIKKVNEAERRVNPEAQPPVLEDFLQKDYKNDGTSYRYRSYILGGVISWFYYFNQEPLIQRIRLDKSTVGLRDFERDKKKAEKVLKETNPNTQQKELENLLRNETQDLKELYIGSVEKAIERDQKWAIGVRNRTIQDWCNVFGITPRPVGVDKWDWPVNFYNTSDARRYAEVKSKMTNILSERYPEKTRKAAEIHYEDSIAKLAERLIRNGVTEEFEIIHKSLGVNFEMTLKTASGKIVNCYTIIADGPERITHYRFLVK
jgi:hypothetical protein